jgi:hypothetical protein
VKIHVATRTFQVFLVEFHFRQKFIVLRSLMQRVGHFFDFGQPAESKCQTALNISGIATLPNQYLDNCDTWSVGTSNVVDKVKTRQT